MQAREADRTNMVSGLLIDPGAIEDWPERFFC